MHETQLFIYLRMICFARWLHDTPAGGQSAALPEIGDSGFSMQQSDKGADPSAKKSRVPTSPERRYFASLSPSTSPPGILMDPDLQL
jgi:hypothetical protein